MNLNQGAFTGKYIPALDGLRALAVLAVLFFHLDIFPFLGGGFIGVDIFFVISGYVISRSIFFREEKSFRAYLGDFYKRRILRIIPALFACLLIFHFLSVLFLPFSWRSDLVHDTGLSAFFGFSNFTQVFRNDGYFSPHAEFNVFLHTWSLGVEEQFYLLFPVVFFFWLKKRVKKNILGLFSWVLLPLMAIVSLVVSAHETVNNQQRAFYLLHSRFWELSAGAVLFQLQTLRKGFSLPLVFSRICFFTGLVLITMALVFTDPWSGFPFPWAILPVLGTLLIIFGLSSTADGEVCDFGGFSNSLMVYIGRISYSLYLWHWPIIVLFRWTLGFNTIWLKLISLVATAVLAVASYELIEKPVRHNEFLRKQQNWKMVVSGLLFLFMGFFLSNWFYDNRSTIGLSQTKNVQQWNSGKYRRDMVEAPVYNNPELKGRRLFALGDSHTAAYRTMLNIVSSRLGVEVFEYEEGGCAIAGLLKPMDSGSREHYENSLQSIKELARAGDIVFLASLRMPELSSRFELLDLSEILEQHFSDEEKKNREIALIQADKIITELEQLGLRVLISAPEPILLIPPYRCSDWFNWNNPIAGPGHSVSTALLRKIREPMMLSLNSLQQKHRELRIWDTIPVLCTGPDFTHYDEKGLPLFYDGDHFSAHGNRILAPSFEDVILDTWKIDERAEYDSLR